MCQAQAKSRAPPINHGARQRSRKIPNIPVGSLPVIAYNNQDPELPFKVLSRYGDYVSTDQVTSRYWQNTKIGLDLASANAMYGGAETVQTASIRGYMLIRYE